MTRYILKEHEQISSPSNCAKYFQRSVGKRQEQFMVLTLNGTHEPIHMYVISVGLVNRTIVHPREVFYPAIKDNSVAIIVAHNHPSGHTDPSPEDIEITKRLHEAGSILGIAVLDHIIIGKHGYYSFIEHDTMPSSEN